MIHKIKEFSFIINLMILDRLFKLYFDLVRL